MKRYLKKDTHRLSDWEKENSWRAIEAETAGRRTMRGTPRRSFRPALGLVSAAAVLVVCFAWYHGTTDSEKGFGAGSPGVVVLPPEMKVDGAGYRDPAADERSTVESEVQAQLQKSMQKTESADIAPIESHAAEESGETILAETLAAAPAPLPKGRPVSEAVAVPAATGGAISGHVVDAETGARLDYVRVLVRGSNRDTMTLGGGYFRFPNLELGVRFELQFMYSGYEPQVHAVTVPDSGRVELTIRLKPVAADVGSAVTESLTQRENARKHAIDSVEEALSKPAGLAPRDGDLSVRGGRSGDAATGGSSTAQSVTLSAARVVSPAPDPGSVTGGTKPPNGERFELMYFDHTGVNPFVATGDDSLSTFAVDVDNASWTVARNYLRRGMMPPKDAIRVEEFVNAFDAGWPTHHDAAFRLHADGSVSRFGQGYHLLRVGVVGRTVADENRKPANLVFVIDVSGSMDRENRLGLVKSSLHMLLDELAEGDRVGIVVYGSSGRVVLEPTDIGRRQVISRAIDSLGPAGSTNAFEGLELAYDMARRHYEAHKLNRLILCSDGVANHGASTEAEQMLQFIRRSSDAGITLSTIGFGMGNYNDVLMEKLANKGDGAYYYVDEAKEAERVFRENLTGLLQTIAREVKVQVEFDKEQVDRWRLLGYENRDVADRDFRNDDVDAGEVGSGHQVTALYEIKLTNDPPQAANLDFFNDEEDESLGTAPRLLGTVRLRHEAPAHDTAHAGEVNEIESPILLEQLTGDFAAGSPWLRTQTVVAEFAEILRGSYWAKGSRLADLVPVADGLVRALPGDEQVRELAELIRIAADLDEAERDQTYPLQREE